MHSNNPIIIKSEQIKKNPTAHNNGIIKNVIFDKTLVPHILQFAFTNFRAGDEIEQHSHETMWEIFFLLNGKILIQIDGKDVELNNNDSIVVPANTFHGFKIIEDSTLLYYNVEE